MGSVLTDIFAMDNFDEPFTPKTPYFEPSIIKETEQSEHNEQHHVSQSVGYLFSNNLKNHDVFPDTEPVKQQNLDVSGHGMRGNKHHKKKKYRKERKKEHHKNIIEKREKQNI